MSDFDEKGKPYYIEPEYAQMSRRPGIGRRWHEKYHRDVYPKDFTHINGRKVLPPKYYDRLQERVDPDQLEAVKQERRKQAELVSDSERNLRRRRTKKEVKEIRHKNYERKYENGN